MRRGKIKFRSELRTLPYTRDEDELIYIRIRATIVSASKLALPVCNVVASCCQKGIIISS